MSAEDAISKARNILDNWSEYCDCCGERWSYWIDDEDGYDVPSKYGESIYENYQPYNKKSKAVLYHIDGKVTYFPE